VHARREDGRYAALPIRVAAVRMHESFAVILADGVSVLAGTPGDWLVDYGDGRLGVIAPEIFASPGALRVSVEAAIAVIPDEHQDWNLLLRPHHLPLG